MRNSIQKGLAAAGFVLVAAVIVLVGGAGYLVWQANVDKGQSSANNTSDTSKAADGDGTDDLVSCEAKGGIKGSEATLDGNFTVCVPNGWTVYHYTPKSSGFVATADSMHYDAAASVKWVEVRGTDSGFPLEVKPVKTTMLEEEQQISSYTKQSAEKLASGATLTSYYHLTGEKDPVGAGIDSLPAGTKQYKYTVAKENSSMTLVVSYNVQPGEVDNHGLIGHIVSSTK